MRSHTRLWRHNFYSRRNKTLYYFFWVKSNPCCCMNEKYWKETDLFCHFPYVFACFGFFLYWHINLRGFHFISRDKFFVFLFFVCLFLLLLLSRFLTPYLYRKFLMEYCRFFMKKKKRKDSYVVSSCRIQILLFSIAIFLSFVFFFYFLNFFFFLVSSLTLMFFYKF